MFTVICIKIHQFVSQQCRELAWLCWCCSAQSLPERELAFKPNSANTEPRNHSSPWNNFLSISQQGSGSTRIRAYSLNPSLLRQHFTTVFKFIYFLSGQTEAWNAQLDFFFLVLGTSPSPSAVPWVQRWFGAGSAPLSPSE